MPMLTLRSQPGRRRFAPLGGLLLMGLSLAACGQAAPATDLNTSAQQNYAQHPLAQVTTASPSGSATAAPGDVKSGASFGNVDALPLTTGPTTPGAATPTALGAATQAPDTGFQPEATKAAAPAPAAGGTKQPADAATGGATIQRSIPPERVDNLYGQLIYVGPGDQIWAVGRDGKNAHGVIGVPAAGDAPGPVSDLNLSPDGKRLLYTVGDGAGGRAYLLDMGKYSLNRTKYNGAWARDSRHVVASVDGQLHVYDVDSGSDEAFGDGSNANWTADNRIIAVRKNNIWAIPYPTSAGKPRQISYLPDTGDAAWVFNGPLQYHYSNRVLFVGGPRKDLGAQLNGLQLHAVDMSTNKVTDLAARGGNGVTGFAVSPSGLQVAWAEQAHDSACVSLGSVRLARADRPGPELAIKLPATESDFFVLNNVTWTPDQWVAYGGQEKSCANLTAKDLGPQRIYLVNPAQPNTPTLLVDGSYPVWVLPRGLGRIDTGAVALR